MSTRILADISIKQQARAMAIGLTTVLLLGMVTALALALAAIWALAQLLLLTVQTIVECANTIAATYQSADPLVKFLLLTLISYVIYRAGRAALRRSNR